jgi:hypothetical protein
MKTAKRMNITHARVRRNKRLCITLSPETLDKLQTLRESLPYAITQSALIDHCITHVTNELAAETKKGKKQ